MRGVRVERIRITRVGIWFIVVALVVGAAAANTGNNALYLVESMLLALLAVSGLVSRRNLRQLEIQFGPRPEVTAGQVCSIEVRLLNRDWLLARRYLLLAGVEAARPLLFSLVPRRGRVSHRLLLEFERRGLHSIPYVRLSSVFPLGLFEKAMRYPAGLEILVYPQILPVSGTRYFDRGRVGDELARRPGWSHELRALRLFRAGDDPRSIHWKRSARTGDLIFMEREAEEGRRLSISLDNATGELGERDRERFERLVVEAASLAAHYLEQGFEVALTTRDTSIPFGRGRLQRRRILRTLALVEPVPAERFPLWSGRPGSTEVRLGLGEGRVAV